MSLVISAKPLQEILANLSLASENKEEQMTIWPKCIDKDQYCLPSLTILSWISGVVNWNNPSQPHIPLHGEKLSTHNRPKEGFLESLSLVGVPLLSSQKDSSWWVMTSSQWEPSQPGRASPYAACAFTSLWHLLLSFKSNPTLEGKRKPDICCWLNPDEVIEITY